MNRETLWKNRFNNYLKETTKYLRFIFNGHLVFVMIILLGGAGFPGRRAAAPAAAGL